ncbi:MAG TPA: hypothetical protein VN019_03180 [Oxalicibacterium sp.]|nr:hypothetical protein [Oxalicibacterium sp.]
MTFIVFSIVAGAAIIFATLACTALFALRFPGCSAATDYPAKLSCVAVRNGLISHENPALFFRLNFLEASTIHATEKSLNSELTHEEFIRI